MSILTGEKTKMQNIIEIKNLEVKNYSDFLALLHTSEKINKSQYQDLFKQLSEKNKMPKEAQNILRKKEIIKKYSQEKKKIGQKQNTIKKEIKINSVMNIHNQIKRNMQTLGIKNKFIIASAQCLFFNINTEHKYKKFCEKFLFCVDKNENINLEKIKKVFDIKDNKYLCFDIFSFYYGNTTTKQKDRIKKATIKKLLSQNYL